jgi:hypothetical protein
MMPHLKTEEAMPGKRRWREEDNFQGDKVRLPLSDLRILPLCQLSEQTAEANF